MSLSDKRQKDKPEIIAKTFYNEFVINTDLDEKGLNISESHKVPFQAKMLAYKFAIVLMALISEERNNSKYSKVRECCEKIIDEKSQGLQERFKNITQETFKQEIVVNFHVDIKRAMVSLNNLLFSEDKKELSWAKKWFEEINIEEYNPVTLTLFSHKIMGYYTTIVKSLGEFEPT